jgi:hypothetical protein
VTSRNILSAMACPRRESESLRIQPLVDSIPALIHTRPDGYLDYFNNQLGRRRRQIVDSDLRLDVRFVLPRPTGAFACRRLNGAACWGNLSALARFAQAPSDRSRVVAAVLARMES